MLAVDLSQNSQAAKNLKETPYTEAGAKALYDNWVGSYDENLKSWGWTPPRLIAEKLTSMGYGAQTEVKVIDLGCGTGLTGEALRSA